jgi:POT family proton-dependent oligopeptide transporter
MHQVPIWIRCDSVDRAEDPSAVSRLRDVPDPDHPPAFRHPAGLRTLFLTEMWERFSYYGNRSLLMLYMTDTAHGGLGMDVPLAAAIYGLFTAAVYLTSLPGGWCADRLLGARQTLIIGAWVIVAGNVCLMLPERTWFLLGLGLIAIGSGLLKPTASAMVGQLYPDGGYRRDAGFTLFYLGINLGAALGPLICSALAAQGSWRWGFIPAGIGMLCGLIQFRYTASRLGIVGERPPVDAVSAQAQPHTHERSRRLLLGCVVVLLLIGAGAVTVATGALRLDVQAIAHASTTAIAVIAVAVIVGILVRGGLTVVERRRFLLVVVLMSCSVVFWAGFEQAGSSLTLFAEDHTDRRMTSSGTQVPAGWFLSLNPVLILIVAPLASALWMRLGRLGRNPSLPLKFALALGLLAVGFLIMRAAAVERLASGQLVSPWWLIMTYCCFTLGELCLSPIGLSAITTLAPQRFASQMLGVWFLATALGNLVAGLLAGRVGGTHLAEMPSTFLVLALAAALIAVILAAAAAPLSRLASRP